MKLIVGLGNPGKEYENTRHNVGFMALDAYTNKNNLLFNNKFEGMYAEQFIDGEKIIFLKPLKYMNLSGEVIKKYVDYFKIDIADILIIHDDMDLDIGSLKIRYKGGSAGHNGLKNIELNLGTNCYKRIKVGISRCCNNDVINYVLGKFENQEKELIDEAIAKVVDIINDYMQMSFENLMNKYN